MTTITPSAWAARQALGDARILRSEYLLSITSGVIEVNDLITAAASREGIALRRISLRQLLMAQPGVGLKRAGIQLELVAERLGISEDISTKPVSWLIDPRLRGSRIAAWCDVTCPKTKPWAGFPLSGPPPKG